MTDKIIHFVIKIRANYFFKHKSIKCNQNFNSKFIFHTITQNLIKLKQKSKLIIKVSLKRSYFYFILNIAFMHKNE